MNGGGMSTLLEVQDLRVNYGEVEAVHNVSLTVGAGQIVTVIGPNGAGKTTSLAAIMGLMNSSGRIVFDGHAQRRANVEKRVIQGLALVPEKRDLFGISFNTSIGGDSLFNGLSLAGELSYRPDTPIALGLNEYLPTALLNPDGLPVGTRLDGYREKDMFQASLAAIYNFNGLLGSDSAALFSELVASRVQGLESDVDYYEATSSAYGAQASLQLTYTNVFNLVNLVPSVGYQYSINGVAPQLTNGLDEEAQSWSVGLDAIYQESLTVGAKYVGYSGGGISNKRTDRDYLTFNVKYSF